MRFILIFLVSVILANCANREGQKFHASKGVIDLNSWNFSKDGIVPLDGEWEFYWNELLLSSNLLSDNEKKPLYYTFPSVWNKYKIDGKPLGNTGYATFRLKILSKSENLQLGIRQTEQATSYNLFVNGELVAKNGLVGKTKEETKPEYLPILTPIRLDRNVNEIILQVANFHHREGGIWASIVIGEYSQLLSFRDYRLGMDIFLCGALVLIGLYHLGYFFMRQNDLSTFYYFLFCFIMFIRVIVTNEFALVHVYKNIDWEFLVKLQYISYAFACPIFILFLKKIFESIKSKFLDRVFILLAAIFCMPVLFTNAIVYSHYLPYYNFVQFAGMSYMIFLISRAIFHKEEGVYLVLLGTLLGIFGAVNDILNAMEILNTGYWLPFGFFVFLILHSFVISRKIANAYSKSEKLSEEMLRANKELLEFKDELELKVQNRTKDLEEAKQKAEQAKSEMELLTEISKKINSNVDISVILDLILEQIKSDYNINFYALNLVNKEKRVGHYFKTHLPTFVTKEQLEFIRLTSVPLDFEGGVHSHVFKNKKYLYIPKMRRDAGSDEERAFIAMLGLKSILIVPLIVQEEVIGMLEFSNVDDRLKLSREDISNISVFCEQIAGGIYSSSLLQLVEAEKKKSDKLLLNILPMEIAEELKEKGVVAPVHFDNITIMFTDFKGFTQIAERMTPKELVKELDACFTQFDKISERYGLEKLKTIGDSYMCAGGLPKENKTHAIDCCLGALEIQSFMNSMKEIKKSMNVPYWELRLGIHTGPVMAGVVGERKFAYDIWSDTVNTASRMESSGTPGRINISFETYTKVKVFFECEYRGEIEAKNKGKVQMYYLNRLLPEFSKDELGKVPNGNFFAKLVEIRQN